MVGGVGGVGGVEIRFPRGGWESPRKEENGSANYWTVYKQQAVCGCGARKDRRFVARKAKSQESGVGSLLEAITVFMSA
jgi:hypothetical protein